MSHTPGFRRRGHLPYHCARLRRHCDHRERRGERVRRRRFTGAGWSRTQRAGRRIADRRDVGVASICAPGDFCTWNRPFHHGGLLPEP